MVDRPRHQLLSDLFGRLLESPRDRRAAVIALECGGDDALREDLESLLAAHEHSAPYFEQLSADVLAPVGHALARGAGEGGEPGITLEALQDRLAGAYRLERELAGAGMSRVFVAEDLKLQRPVVIKLLPSESLPSNGRELFEREIALAARLQHPHIVPLLGAESSGELLFYTMPFVAGESLRDRLAREGRLEVGEALRIWRDVVDAIAHAHASGVVHRDIKPGNVLLSNRHALVADFGIAYALESISGDEQRAHDRLLGTPSYLAPEQAAGTLVAGQSADIYQAGLLMYEMLSGTLPFPTGSTRDVLQRRVLGEPSPLLRGGAPAPLVELVMRCLDRDPGRRPSSAVALLAAIESQAAPPMLRRRPATYAIALAAAVASLATVAYFLWGREPAVERAAMVAASPVGLAILPLTVAGDDPEARALASGVAQEMAAILARNPGLRVVPSSSVEGFDYRKLGPAGIAAALHVTHLLAGELRRDGSRLHLSAQLVDAVDNRTLWREVHDREFNDVLGMPTAIGDAVIRTLLGGAHAQSAASPPLRRTASAAAYQWYLLGMDERSGRTEAGTRQSVEYFKRAIAADPTFSSAYAGLAHRYAMLSTEIRTDAQRTLRAEAWKAATRAVELDDSNPEAQVALGLLHLYSWNFPAAEDAIKRAIALDPQVPRGYELLALLYMYTGRTTEQLAAAQAGLERTPRAFGAIRAHALALATNGRCEESLAPLQELKLRNPPAQVAGVIRGLCFLTRKRWDEGIAELRWAQARGARSAEGFVGFALARSGRRAEALAVLSRLTSGESDSHGAFGVAVVYAGLGDFDQAYLWLSKAIDEDTVWTYMWHPVLQDLRRDPRFALVQQRLGITR